MARTNLASSFFSRLSPELRKKLEEASTRMTFSDRQQLQSRGDKDLYFSVIRKGRVRFGTTGRNGVFVFSAQMREGDPFGDIAIFGASARVQDAYSVGETVIDRIPKSRFLTLVEENSELALALLRIMGKRLVMALDQLDDVLRQPLIVRLGRYLLMQQKTGDGSNRVDIGQSVLAEAMAASRVSVSKCLKELSALGYVETGYGYLTIKDPVRMENWISGEEQVVRLES